MKKGIREMVNVFDGILADACVKQWDVEVTKRHSKLRFVRADGRPGMLVFPCTSSDHRAVKNASSTLRRLLAA
ncbi:hypothetical protein [Azospirillum sp. TSO5]|uniref:hypothetical protein n=1 Tax=Azospirillum sp. TSO5 TaxID=716760 RepID=UPI000D60FA5A|nr:hypothetical protein [Azospirillum sp. TSO5]PWC92953.1 hypothetical protein TSO5_16120 [Azospirillum sp. TSO5]